MVDIGEMGHIIGQGGGGKLVWMVGQSRRGESGTIWSEVVDPLEEAIGDKEKGYDSGRVQMRSKLWEIRKEYRIGAMVQRRSLINLLKGVMEV